MKSSLKTVMEHGMTGDVPLGKGLRVTSWLQRKDLQDVTDTGELEGASDAGSVLPDDMETWTDDTY